MFVYIEPNCCADFDATSTVLHTYIGILNSYSMLSTYIQIIDTSLKLISSLALTFNPNIIMGQILLLAICAT